MKPYKIAVVGPIPKDTITTHRGEVITKYGCITHPTIALGKLLENIGTVYPITHIFKKDKNHILELFRPFKNIHTEGVFTDKDQGTIVELNFVDQNNRLEKQTANMHPITPNEVKPFLDVDCFVFVPITDYEIQLETLKFIKSNSNAQIIFDAHGPTTFVTENGERLRQFWKDKDEWLPYIDVLKMNLEESICSWIEDDYTSEELYDENNTAHLDDFAKYILEHGGKMLYVTLDSRGCMVYHQANSNIQKEFVKSVKVENVVDTTGCGDSFAGGLAYGFTVHNNHIVAAQYANVLGAMRTQGKDFGVFKSLSDTEKILNEAYS